MDDFEELVDQVRAGADRRGLRLMEAEFPGKPDVIFRHGTASVDEVLDVAQQSFAPFVSLAVSRLDTAELVESWGEKDFFSELTPEPPAELLRLWEERTGQIDGVFVEWVGGGATYIYLAVPVWKQELEKLRDGWSEDRDAQRVDDYRAELIRITHLAELLEQDPEYRAGNLRTRTSIGTNFVEDRLQSNEGSFITRQVLKEASRMVRDNAQAAFAKLMGQVDEMAAELRGSREWQTRYLASDRLAAARNFLIERSGGYSPSVDLARELRRLAE
ncbi:hypothetical protein [Arthrobacter sp. NPDC057013]|uniref:hypothetical protein n=1 Tax=Arthrobacter sp. NPDC057013 TaxID=3345999 RepID=UPI003640852D